MPLYLELVSLDAQFHNSVKEPIIINDLQSKTEEDREYFKSLIRETYSSDMVTVLPQCHCGELKGEHVIGEVCDLCNTVVRQNIEADVAPSLWFRRPENVEKLLNPIVWVMLSNRFTRSKFKILNWLTDRNYNPNIKVPDIVHKMVADGVPRGYNAFVQNFDSIMEYLFNIKDFKLKKGATNFIMDMLGITHPSSDPLQQLIIDHRDILFSDYIPIPNRSLLVLEKSALGTYVDDTTFDIHDTLNTMLSIDRDYYDKTQISIENRTAKILSMLTEYYMDLFRKNLSPKEGLIRKHVYGSRGNHGFRAVITSHEEIHDHDEIWIPWCVGVTVFRQHILNKLMRRDLPYGGLTHNQAIALMMEHVNQYHPTLHAILNELIHNSRNGKISLLIQRNPTLMQGSAQLVYITKVKTNPEDQTVSMSDLIAVAMNA